MDFFFVGSIGSIGSLGAQGPQETQGAREPPAFFQKAQTHVQERDLSRALQVLERGLQKASDFADGWVLLGQVYLLKGLPQEATSALSKGLAIQDSPRVHLLLAQSFHLQGIYPEAIRHYQAVIEMSPGSSDSGRAQKSLNQIGKTPQEADEARDHFEKASAYLKQGEFSESLEEAQALLRLLPEHLAGLSLEARILSMQGEMDQAIMSMQKAVGIDPSFYRGFYQLAGLHHAGGRSEEAIKNYRRVIQINPRSLEAKEAGKRLRQIGQNLKESEKAEELIGQARAFVTVGLTRKSYSLMVEALQLVPDNPSANYLMAQIQAGLGLWKEAIKSYQDVIQVEPENYASFFQIGLLFQLQGRFKEAVVQYQAAIFLKEDAPESKEAKRRLKEIGGSPEIAQRLEEILEEVEERLDQKDLDGAVVLYEEASQLIPDNADIYYQMGLILKQAAKLEEAISALKSALEKNPTFTKAHFTLALILEEEGRISEAIQSYAMVANFGEGTEEGKDAKERFKLLKTEQGGIIQAKSHIDRANQLKKMNDLAGAILSYKAAISAAPNLPNIHLNLGRTYFLRGQMEEAFRSLQKALELESTMVQALFTLGLIYHSKGLYLEAIETYQKVESYGTDERELELVKGELQKSRRKFIDRTESYQFIQIGSEALEENKPLEALKAFESAVRLDPLNFSLNFQLGLLYQERSLTDLAISSFQKAIEIKPWYAESHLRLAELYELQQSYGKAIAEYEIYDAFTHKALELDPQQDQENILRIEALKKNYQKAFSDGEAHFDKAKQHIKDEQFELAKEAMQVALFFDPENFLYHSNLGFVYYAQNLKIQARSVYRRALSLNPEYAPVHHSIGIILEEHKIYEDAMEAYDLAIHYGLKGTELEKAQEGRQRVAGVIERLDKAQTHRLQAFEFTKEGEDEKALEEYLKANALEPDATVFLNIGLLYHKAQETEKAEKAFLDAIAFKSEARFLVQLTNFYLDEDRFEEAVQALEKTIQVAQEEEKKSIGKAEESPGLKRVKSRIDRKRKRLSASASTGFLSFTDNRSSSATNPQPNISSSFGVGLRYLIKQTRRFTFPVSIRMNHSFSYLTQSYSNSESFSAPLTYRVNDTFTLSGTYGFSVGINRLGPSSYNHSFSLRAALGDRRFFSPSLTYSFRKTISFRTRRSDSSTQSLALSLGKGFRFASVGFGYSLGTRSAFRREQESISHSGSLSLSRTLLPGVRGNVSFSLGLSLFPNPDSLGRTRENVSKSVRAGLSYSVGQGFSLRANYTFQTARTNLGPVPEEFTDLLEGLVVPLSAFQKNSISLSASLSF